MLSDKYFVLNIYFFLENTFKKSPLNNLWSVLHSVRDLPWGEVSSLNHNIKLKVNKYYWLCNTVMNLFSLLLGDKQVCLTDVHAFILEWMAFNIYTHNETNVDVYVCIHTNIFCSLRRPRSNDALVAMSTPTTRALISKSILQLKKKQKTKILHLVFHEALFTTGPCIV